MKVNNKEREFIELIYTSKVHLKQTFNNHDSYKKEIEGIEYKENPVGINFNNKDLFAYQLDILMFYHEYSKQYSEEFEDMKKEFIEKWAPKDER